MTRNPKNADKSNTVAKTIGAASRVASQTRQSLRRFAAKHSQSNEQSRLVWYTWLAVLSWMAVIFMFSHQPADISSQQSGVIRDTLDSAGVELSMTTVRKTAHVAAYLLLGILAYNLARHYSRRTMVCVLLAIGLCGLYAISDEFHQNFVVGRSAEATDVLLDSASSAVGSGASAMYVVRPRLGAFRNKNRGKT